MAFAYNQIDLAGTNLRRLIQLFNSFEGLLTWHMFRTSRCQRGLCGRRFLTRKLPGCAVRCGWLLEPLVLRRQPNILGQRNHCKSYPVFRVWCIIYVGTLQKICKDLPLIIGTWTCLMNLYEKHEVIQPLIFRQWIVTNIHWAMHAGRESRGAVESPV